ncbi:MAG: hypothetical protein IKG01_10035 [Lachnospiraceae bacterium]|nr:hypothetical protein [Lachnospiraceae bacterium]
MQACLSEAQAIMRIILKVYDAMDEYDIIHWSRKEAEYVVADQILMDRLHGVEPLPYKAEDFYDTIYHLIRQDYSRLRLFFLRIKQKLKR